MAPLEGLHHVTCITGDAPRNVEFYTGVMGLRLVAKSVNQDDPTVYHLFYADEQGDPGSDITFFEYPGAAPGRAGSGMVYRVVWRLGSPEALEFWRGRLSELGVSPRTSEQGILFNDPEGLEHELAVSTVGDEPLIADHPEIPREMALQGFGAVRAYSRDAERSSDLLQAMGAESVGPGSWELRGERRGGTISYDEPPAEQGVPGAGTVHHVAWFSTVEDHPAWPDRLRAAGMRPTDVIDRHYFRSIYFREPSGVLFEIADEGPGFTVDGPVEDLGKNIILPPSFESQRPAIERILTPLPDPRASWAQRS